MVIERTMPVRRSFEPNATRSFAPTFSSAYRLRFNSIEMPRGVDEERQRPGEPRRRWFTADHMELTVRYVDSGRVTALQRLLGENGFVATFWWVWTETQATKRPKVGAVRWRSRRTRPDTELPWRAGSCFGGAAFLRGCKASGPRLHCRTRLDRSAGAI